MTPINQPDSVKSITVPQTAPVSRLDSFVAGQLNASRNEVGKWIKAGLVTVNDQPERVSYQIQAGDSIVVSVPAAPATARHAAPNLPVVYEDDDILVIDKPPHLTVHGGSGTQDQATVADFARLHTNDPDPERPGIVHRLDRDTSGLMIIAKTTEAKTAMQRQFRERKVHKTYQVLATGHVSPEEAVLRLPIERDPAHPLRRAVVVGGRPAITRYQTVAAYPGFTHLEAKPETGRTHQLRVHMAALGYPIAGDTTYGLAVRSLRTKAPFPPRQRARIYFTKRKEAQANEPDAHGFTGDAKTASGLSMKTLVHPRLSAQLEKLLAQRSGSYIFHGPRGVGKTTAALEIARAMNCLGDNGAVCAHCKQFMADTYPDLIVLKPEDKPSVTIEQVRNLVQATSLRLYYAKGTRGVIIDDAHLLTVDAQNALLKLIEEPPAQTLFILVSDQLESLLPTVRSRCISLYFPRLEISAIAKLLETLQGLRPSEATRIAQLAEGLPSRAVSLAANPEEAGKRQAASELVASVTALNRFDRLLLARKLHEEKFDIAQLGQDLQKRLINELHQNRGNAEDTARQLGALEKFRRQLQAKVSPQVALESLMLEL